MITYEELHEQLMYNPWTGIFYWKIRKRGVKGYGFIAGGKSKNGYIQIVINGKSYRAHRLAWLFVYKYFPENDIDHKDNNPFHRHHNWISNLREASRQCNIRNTGNPKNNTSEIKGVYWHKQTNKWYTNIVVNKRNRSLGRYKDFDDAVCARLAGEQCLNWEGCDSNSPAYQYVKNTIRITDQRYIH